MSKQNGKEELLMSPETIDKIYDIHEYLIDIHPVIKEEIPQMKTLLSSITNSQNTMASAAASMAAVSEKAEIRYSKLEERLQEVNDKAAGKGQIPLWSHYIVLCGTLLIAVLFVLYSTQQTIEATLTSVKVQNGK